MPGRHARCIQSNNVLTPVLHWTVKPCLTQTCCILYKNSSALRTAVQVRYLESITRQHLRQPIFPLRLRNSRTFAESVCCLHLNQSRQTRQETAGLRPLRGQKRFLSCPFSQPEIIICFQKATVYQMKNLKFHMIYIVYCFCQIISEELLHFYTFINIRKDDFIEQTYDKNRFSGSDHGRGPV